jgi:serine O-acetyltransferase
MLRLMRLDLDRTVDACTDGTGAHGLRYWAHLIVPSAFSAIIFRLAHWLHRTGWRRLAALATLCNQRLCGVSIHPASRIGPGLFIPHTVGVHLCCEAGRDLGAYPMVYVGPPLWPGWMGELPADSPRLGDKVLVGANSAVVGGVTLGDGVLVGIQVVVQKDVAPGSSLMVRPNWRTLHAADAAEPVDTSGKLWRSRDDIA